MKPLKLLSFWMNRGGINIMFSFQNMFKITTEKDTNLHLGGVLPSSKINSSIAPLMGAWWAAMAHQRRARSHDEKDFCTIRPSPTTLGRVWCLCRAWLMLGPKLFGISPLCSAVNDHEKVRHRTIPEREREMYVVFLKM